MDRMSNQVDKRWVETDWKQIGTQIRIFTRKEYHQKQKSSIEQ